MQLTELVNAYTALQNTTIKYSTQDHSKDLSIISDMLISMIMDKVGDECYADDEDIEELVK